MWKRRSSGAGIGLALVQRIVARHDGWIWMEGMKGDGLTVTFTLGAKRW